MDSGGLGSASKIQKIKGTRNHKQIGGLEDSGDVVASLKHRYDRGVHYKKNHKVQINKTTEPEKIGLTPFTPSKTSERPSELPVGDGT